MDVEIVQLTRPEDRGEVPREGYEARRHDGSSIWRVDVDLGGTSPSPFREEAIWAEAGAVAIGGKSVVVLLELSSGAELRRIDVPSHFGHVAVQRVNGEEWLFVLGWRDVHAFAPNLAEQWVRRGLAVDGISGGTVEGHVLHLSAEMDPPGGWFDVQLDVCTGRELVREPAFTDDYVGIYGTGKKNEIDG
jgi:hypothetical protein